MKHDGAHCDCEAVRHSTRCVRRYEQQIRQGVRQEERARLARDLHDAVKQQLFVIQTAAATVQTRFDTDADGARIAIEQVRSSTREAMTEMNVMLDQLQAAPLENTGLIASLRQQCEALGFRTGAEVAFEPGALPAETALPPGAREAVLRAAQEALSNVARHARAKTVQVALAVEGPDLVLTVRDDGSGIVAKPGSSGMGMANLAARAQEIGGRFELDSVAASRNDRALCGSLRQSPRRRLLETGGALGPGVACRRRAVDRRGTAAEAMGRNLGGHRPHCGHALRRRQLPCAPWRAARVNIITIALVDDHRVVARSLQAYLESFADLKVVGVATTRRGTARAARRLETAGRVAGPAAARRNRRHHHDPAHPSARTRRPRHRVDRVTRRSPDDGGAPRRRRGLRSQGRGPRDAARRGARGGSRQDLHRPDDRPADPRQRDDNRRARPPGRPKCFAISPSV